jgi:hypothetical protein
MDIINSCNFNIITWFNVCEQGRFEYDVEIIDPVLYEKKITYYKWCLNTRKPMELSFKLARLMHENAARIKNPRNRMEYIEALNYIILVSTLIPHRARVKLLRFAYSTFLACIADINKRNVNQNKNVCRFVEWILHPLLQFMKDMINKELGQFVFNIKKLPYRYAVHNLVTKVDAEELILLTDLAIIKKVIKEPIMENFVHKYDTNGWAESFKRYNTKRENRTWIKYFVLKKECNKAKFQKGLDTGSETVNNEKESQIEKKSGRYLGDEDMQVVLGKRKKVMEVIGRVYGLWLKKESGKRQGVNIK